MNQNPKQNKSLSSETWVVPSAIFGSLGAEPTPKTRINWLNCPGIIVLFCTRNSIFKASNVLCADKFRGFLQGIEKCKYKGQKHIKVLFCQDPSFCFHLILLFLAFIHSSFMHASKQLSISSSVDFPLCCCCLNYKLRRSSCASLSDAFFQSLHIPI